MMRPGQFFAAAIVAALAAAALTACTRSLPNEALDWLRQQEGVEFAAIVVDRTTMMGSTGTIRAELEDDLSDGALDGLIQLVIDYEDEHPYTDIQLGHHLVDFAIHGGADTRAARDRWAELLPVEGLVAALVDWDGTYAHVLRDDLIDVLDATRAVSGTLEIEAFRTSHAEEADRHNDDYGPRQRSAGSFQVTRDRDCSPSVDQWTRTVATAAKEEIDEGTVDTCGGYELIYREETELTVVATEWAAAQETSDDPVPTLVVKEDGAGYHEISVTPGDASLFPVVAAFEAPGAPVVQYWLAAGGSLDLRGYDDPPGEVLALLAQSPIAADLTSISLQGDIEGPVGGEQVTATGTLEQLGTLVTDAEALMPLDPSFYQVAIDATSVSIDLYSPPGSDPDMASAAVALRSNPIWTTRDTYVNYMQGYVLIHEGVAELGSDTYSRPGPLEAFAAAWNAGATP